MDGRYREEGKSFYTSVCDIIRYYKAKSLIFKLLNDPQYVESLCDKFLQHLDNEDEVRKEFVTLLLDFYEGQGKTLFFLKGLISKEVEKSKDF